MGEGRGVSEGLWRQVSQGGWLLELRARGMECEECCTAVFLQSENRDFLRFTLLAYNSLNVTA